MAWNQLKLHARHLNVFTSTPSKVAELLRSVFENNISQKNWKNYVEHVIKEEKKFKKIDLILDNDIEPVIINVGGESDDEDDKNDEIYYE